MTGFAGASVVFRTDASLQIGSGHVMRCLTLATALKARGAHCCFVGRSHAGDLLAHIGLQGHEVIALPAAPQARVVSTTATAHGDWLGTDWASDARQTLAALQGRRADWLIVDHYALDAGWEQALHPHAERLMVIDDIADRLHICDLLLDQNLGRQSKDYADLVPPACRVLVGPRFALLRPEFAALRRRSLERRAGGGLEHVLVTMGGVDRPNATGAVLETLNRCALPAGCRIDVVMGAAAPWLAEVRDRALHMFRPTQLHVDVADMARLMADADLAIGAAGGTAWERCCLGLASLLVVLADNQRAGARALTTSGAALLLGETAAVATELPGMLCRMLEGRRLAAMSTAASQVCDGQGVDRVLAEMVGVDG